jgi:hypothetical protein
VWDIEDGLERGKCIYFWVTIVFTEEDGLVEVLEGQACL